MLFWLWITIIISSIILEIITASQLITIWFSVGALIALIANQLGASFPIQVFLFFIVSIGFIIVCRPLVKNYLRGNIVHTNADRVIGQQTRLLEAINNDQWGLVKIQGVEWHATSVDSKPIESNQMVEIVAIEGSKVLVKKI